MPTALNLTAILMLTTAALADMPGDRAVESPWTTRYFDTHLDMQLDLDWIAVQSADLSNDHITVTGGPTADLSKARSGSVHQWFYVPFTDAATPQDIADIVVDDRDAFERVTVSQLHDEFAGGNPREVVGATKEDR